MEGSLTRTALHGKRRSMVSEGAMEKNKERKKKRVLQPDYP